MNGQNYLPTQKTIYRWLGAGSLCEVPAYIQKHKLKKLWPYSRTVIETLINKIDCDIFIAKYLHSGL